MDHFWDDHVDATHLCSLHPKCLYPPLTFIGKLFKTIYYLVKRNTRSKYIFRSILYYRTKVLNKHFEEHQNLLDVVEEIECFHQAVLPSVLSDHPASSNISFSTWLNVTTGSKVKVFVYFYNQKQLNSPTSIHSLSTTSPINSQNTVSDQERLNLWETVNLK